MPDTQPPPEAQSNLSQPAAASHSQRGLAEGLRSLAAYPTTRAGPDQMLSDGRNGWLDPSPWSNQPISQATKIRHECATHASCVILSLGPGEHMIRSWF